MKPLITLSLILASAFLAVNVMAKTVPKVKSTVKLGGTTTSTAGLVITGTIASDIVSQLQAATAKLPLTQAQINALNAQFSAIVNQNLSLGVVVDGTEFQKIIDANAAVASVVKTINGQPTRTVTATDVANTAANIPITNTP